MNRAPSNRKPAGQQTSSRPPFNKSAAVRPLAGKPPSVSPTTRRPPQPPKPDARTVAFNIMQNVMHKGAFASLTLDDKLTASELSPVDRALVTRLVYGVVEERRLLDYRLDKYLTDPKSVSPLVRDMLRLGAYQILFLDRIPVYSALNETVELAKRTPGGLPFTGLINVVLRRLAAGKNEPIEWPFDPLEAFAIKTSWPLWLLEKLSDAYGAEETARIAKLRAHDTGITIRLNPLKNDAAAFEKRMTRRDWKWRKALLPGSYYITSSVAIGSDPDYSMGRFSVEGTASMLAAEAVGAKRGMRILDACAAPGGKTAYMAERMNQSGRVFAVDIHPHRVKLIRSQAARLGLDNVKYIECDISKPRAEWRNSFDAVLVDAPCSGLGAAVDKPDIRGRLNPEDIDELLVIQRDILDTCADYVKPGGTLVYATCSILPEENVRQAERFLSSHKDYTIDMKPLEPFRPGEYGLQLLPRFTEGDNPIWIEGFFIARMIRSRGGVNG